MNKKILVLEKNRDILELINIVLTEKGYIVDLLATEDEVFNHIRDFQPDIILLDIINPTEEGTALCKTIKAAEQTSHIPVIVLSTHPKVEIVKEICADEVVPKPFNISFLIQTIEQQLINV
ncbi:response regulator transcription factor [Pedobacter sp. PAMC26386]|nr:response regulator transcription factor [Pedobacter sp. PAMC26386]